MRGPKDDPTAEIPDLVVEPPRVKLASPIERAAAAPPALDLDLHRPEIGQTTTGLPEAELPSFGGTILSPELDMFDGATADAFELGLELEPLAGSAPPHWAAGATHTSAGAATSAAPSQRAANTPWPTGTTPGDDELPIVPREIERLADFGAAPTFLLATPVYALRVWKRRRILKARAAAAQRTFAEIERERDDRVAQIAETARPLLEGEDRYHTLLVEVRAHEDSIADGEAHLGASAAELQAQEAELQARLDDLEGDLRAQDEAVARERDATAALQDRLGRVEARHKRIEIERRALLDVARRKLGPEGGALPADLAAPLAELDKREEALRPELVQERAALEAARARLTAAENARELTRQRTVELHARKTAFTTRSKQEVAERSRSLEEARARRRVALVEMGRAVLAMRGHVPVDEEQLEPIRVLDARVRHAAGELQRLQLAHFACDSVAVQRGIWVLGLAAVAAGLCPFLL